MTGITTAQMRKIHALAREHKIDNELLHEFVFSATGKKSLKELTIMEAVKIIDELSGEKQATPGMMTAKQWKYIEGLLEDLGWQDDAGNADNVRFMAFVRERFKIERKEWITALAASKIIEAFKDMLSRQAKKKDVV